jgi:hypothetical protein
LGSTEDRNTGGIGLLLRLSSVGIPTFLCIVLLLTVERGSRGVAALASAASGPFKVLAFLWSWPYGMYQEHPFSFGALGATTVLMAIVLALRHDRRGWASALVYSLAFGWVVATIIGQAQGS